MSNKSQLLAIALLFSWQALFADDWPQWRGPNRDGVWHETGIIDTLDNLEIRWRVPVSSGYCGPTIANGRVYVMDRVSKPEQIERVLCFEWQTGNLLWSHQYGCQYVDVGYIAGPRASVAIHQGLAYSLGTMGNLFCFNAETGEIQWQRDMKSEYQIRMPIWGIAAAPLVENDLVIVQIGGSDGACIVALDRKNGHESWRALDDKASYSAPIIIRQNGRRVLVCWTAESIVGLDPESGKVYWRHPFETNMGLAVSTPVFSNNRLLITAFFDGALLLKVEQESFGVTKLWWRKGESETKTDALHSLISTPIFENGYIYGIDAYGQMRCLRADNGDRLWESLDVVPKARWSAAHLIQNKDRVWIFNERGELLITKLSPHGIEIISRTKLIEPTKGQLNRRGGVCWTHPAFAYQHVFIRNDRELLCASLKRRD